MKTNQNKSQQIIRKMFTFVVYLLMIVAIFEQATSALEHGVLTVKRSTAVDENQSEHFCIAYNPDNTTLPKENSFHPLLDLSSSSLCKDPVQPGIIKGKVVIVKNGNCSLLEKSLIAQKYGADSIIISVNGSQKMKFNGSEVLQISVAIILDDDVKLIKKGEENLVASLSAPDQPILDYNMALIWIMATGTAIGGALWGGTRAHKAVLRKKNKQRRRAETVEDEQTNNDDADSDDSVPITSMFVIIWVFMIVIVLLLMFFLYDYFVYVIIALYCLGAVNGLYICLSPFVLAIFPFKTRIVCCSASDKMRPLVVSVVLVAVCASFVVIWFCFRHADFAWILLDMMGIAFCISILKTIRLSDFKTCFLLLSLLFFYDIFMVFVTPYITKSGESIMVEVATGSGGTKEQIPVLLQVPRLCTSVYSVCNATAYSMLGFGDILIPGLLISHCYAFDLKVNSKRIYLISTSIAYGTGLLITFAALAVMQMGQPALLYLVPTTVGTALTVAMIRGEVRHLWNGNLDKKDEGDTVDVGTVTSSSASRVTEEGHVTCHKRNNGSNESLEPLMESEVVNVN
ncbi:signal peptide peptidase-like 2B [Anneissia japonica]|uniref:signal peptide peptidase-like 2B n=1 Tax=Anneissia japonica TaxID=1529436 RepID=UPI00142567C3|nr:signal peptide peptidase-like 2B [Anneissia japonica]